MNRRSFIQNSTVFALGTSMSSSLISCGSNTGTRHKIGIILNTVKNEMAEDFRSTLRALKDMGYSYLEGSFYGDSLSEYAKEVRSLGFESICSGSAMGSLLTDYDTFVRNAKALGQEYIVCYYPWMVGNSDIDADSTNVTIENLNKLGKRLKESGFKFCWHPHKWEFQDWANGAKPFDLIMQNTDPEYVSLQMDLYWVVRGGGDPIHYMNKYPGRTKMFHVKDMGTDGSIDCVGDGEINFKPILDYAMDVGIEYWFVENETDQSNLDCARQSFNHISNLI